MPSAEERSLESRIHSDLLDVLAHVAYALPTLTRKQRATKAKVAITTHFNTKQQVFLAFVLSGFQKYLLSGTTGGMIPLQQCD